MQLSGLKIVADIAAKSFSDLFVTDCPMCWGTGTMTCPACKGTKNLLARPKQLVPRKAGGMLLLHRVHEATECHQCAPPLKLDFDLTSDDVNDDGVALSIIANLHAAAAGHRMPYSLGPTAGVVVCPACSGTGTAHRNVPTVDMFAGRSQDIWTKVRHCLLACPRALADAVPSGRWCMAIDNAFGPTTLRFHVQCLMRSGMPVSSDHERLSCKPARVPRFREYPELPSFTFDEIALPFLMHPILVPSAKPDEARRDRNEEFVGKPITPWRYMLPQLKSSSARDVNSEFQFP